MLRRTRYFVPLVAALSAVAGAVAGSRVLLLLPVIIGFGVLVEHVLSGVEENRLRHVADQVVAFASDVERPPALEERGSREWQRLVVALNDVARVLRERFQALRQERERVQLVLDAVPASVMLFSGGTLAYANPAAREAFALGELGDVDVRTPVRVLAAPGLASAVEEVGETGRDVTVSVTRNGRELAASASRVAPDEVALIVTDLTDLQRVHDMRRDFVANASHELKTPVTGMQALADSLQMAMEKDPERARTMAHRIQLEATRLARLVRDLLDLTRLEEDGGARVRQRVDLAPMVRIQVARLDSVAAERGIVVSVEDHGGASVVGIPEDLKLIVGNLVLNAIQYNKVDGKVHVTLSRADSEVELRVADTGIGIPAADQDRVFERFYRVDKARSRAAGGTGLGLSLVRHAVERHHGTITVDSVLGEGSTFVVRLPIDGGVSLG